MLVQRGSTLCPGDLSLAKEAGARENGDHASVEVSQFTLIYAPLLDPRCEMLIPLQGFMARSETV